MDHLVADVERQSEQRVALKDAGHLREGAFELTIVEVDDRVDGDGAGKGMVRERQVEHVAEDEIDVGKKAPPLFDHFAGEVEADRLNASFCQVGADVARSTPEVDHAALTRNG